MSSTHIETKIDADAQKLTIDALFKLYSFPHSAVVREYVCNALDEHTDSGVTRPVEVDLHVETAGGPDPYAATDLRVVLSVHDYGRGMDADTLTRVYTQIKLSGKRADRAQTGGFGIGAKSAFSVTDRFVVLTNDGTTTHMLRCHHKGSGEIVNSLTTDETGIRPEVGTTVRVEFEAARGDLARALAMAVNLAKINNMRLVTRIEHPAAEVDYDNTIARFPCYSSQVDPRPGIEGSRAWEFYPYAVISDPAAAIEKMRVDSADDGILTGQVMPIIDDALLARLGLALTATERTSGRGLFANDSLVAYVSGAPYPAPDVSRDDIAILGDSGSHLGIIEPALDNTEIVRSRESLNGMTRDDLISGVNDRIAAVSQFYAGHVVDMIKGLSFTSATFYHDVGKIVPDLALRLVNDLGIGVSRADIESILDGMPRNSILPTFLTATITLACNQISREYDHESFRDRFLALSGEPKHSRELNASNDEYGRDERGLIGNPSRAFMPTREGLITTPRHTVFVSCTDGFPTNMRKADLAKIRRVVYERPKHDSEGLFVANSGATAAAHRVDRRRTFYTTTRFVVVADGDAVEQYLPLVLRQVRSAARAFRSGRSSVGVEATWRYHYWTSLDEAEHTVNIVEKTTWAEMTRQAKAVRSKTGGHMYRFDLPELDPDGLALNEARTGGMFEVNTLNGENDYLSRAATLDLMDDPSALVVTAKMWRGGRLTPQVPEGDLAPLFRFSARSCLTRNARFSDHLNPALATWELHMLRRSGIKALYVYPETRSKTKLRDEIEGQTLPDLSEQLREADRLFRQYEQVEREWTDALVVAREMLGFDVMANTCASVVRQFFSRLAPGGTEGHGDVLDALVEKVAQTLGVDAGVLDSTYVIAPCAVRIASPGHTESMVGSMWGEGANESLHRAQAAISNVRGDGFARGRMLTPSAAALSRIAIRYSDQLSNDTHKHPVLTALCEDITDVVVAEAHVVREMLNEMIRHVSGGEHDYDHFIERVNAQHEKNVERRALQEQN